MTKDKKLQYEKAIRQLLKENKALKRRNPLSESYNSDYNDLVRFHEKILTDLQKVENLAKGLNKKSERADDEAKEDFFVGLNAINDLLLALEAVYQAYTGDYRAELNAD